MAKTTDLFYKHLENALKKYNDPVWLGEHSPLATPYLLGDQLALTMNNRATECGKALQQLIKEAALEMQTESRPLGAEYFQVLDLLHFKDKSADYVAAELNMGRGTVYNRRTEAIKELKTILLNRLKPTLRLESPPLPPTILLGREQEIEYCEQAIAQRQTIILEGLEGVGKTAIASQVIHKMPSNSIFWFTFHRDLNDHIDSLLFSLAYFFFRLGTKSLWAQLIAKKTETQLQDILHGVRYDLDNIQCDHTIILCFDELDQLNINIEEHKRILKFLEQLRGLTRLVLIGQQISHLDADVRIKITGLSIPHIKMWLTSAGMSLNDMELASLQNYTKGIPRLIEMFTTLHKVGNPLTKTLAELTEAPSLQWLFYRVWDRLAKDVRGLLMSLSVHEQSVPSNVWLAQDHLQSLRDLHLVQISTQEGVSILPMYREYLAKKLSAEQQDILHQEAAQVRERYGQYTVAADHYIKAGTPDIAIKLWYEHKQYEIGQGQASAALQLFKRISLENIRRKEDLSKKEELLVRDQLRALLSELAYLMGDYEQVRQITQIAEWHSPALQADTYQTLGRIYNLENNSDHALAIYAEGRALLQVDQTDRYRQIAEFWIDEAYTYARKNDLDNAVASLTEASNSVGCAMHGIEELREQINSESYINLGKIVLDKVLELLKKISVTIQQTACKMENEYGSIKIAKGKYDEATDHLHKALELAQELGDSETEAKIYNHLAQIAFYLGEKEEVTCYRQKAEAIFKKIGRVDALLSLQINNASTLNLFEDYCEALQKAEEALGLAEALDNKYHQILLWQVFAESYLGLHNLERAEEHVLKAIESANPEILPDSYRTLGEIRCAQGNLQKAHYYIEKSKGLSVEKGDLWLEAYACRALGKVWAIEGKIPEALQEYNRAIEIFESLNAQVEVKKTQALRSKVMCLEESKAV